MALTKIISIKNVGRFLDFATKGDLEFKRYNLIFGENGRGKTTLCAIFRSLRSGDNSYILGRTTLNGQGTPEIHFLLENSHVRFRGETWSSTPLDIAIFDDTFVSDNIHAGIVDTEHKRNLYKIIIGKDGVELAKQIEDLDAASRAKASDIKNACTDVKTLIPSGGPSFDEFLKLTNDPDIDAKIAAKKKDLEAASDADRLRTRPDLKPLHFPGFSDQFESLLAAIPLNLSGEDEQLIISHITRHGMQARAKNWLLEGLKYIHAETCPFCSQSLAGIDLVTAYRAFFSEAYNQLKRNIEKLREDINTIFSDQKIGSIETTVSQNETAIEFWGHYCDLPTMDLKISEGLADTIRQLRKVALNLLDRKIYALLERVTLDDIFRQKIIAYESLVEAAVAYNRAVAMANETIANRKVDAGTADKRAIELELSRLYAMKKRYTHQAIDACKTYYSLQDQKDELDKQKANVKVKLDSYTKKVIGTYEERINYHLDKFNAGFRIIKTTHNYSGGVAGSSYQILINQTSVDLGNARTPLNQPSFRNTLSSGDRSVLALAFFLAQLELDPNRVEKVVVFDDPFSSQDSFRRTNTVFQIKRCGDNCRQVFILSHNQSFLKQVWNVLPSAERKALHLPRIGADNTVIDAWDINEAIKARYQQDIEALQRFHSLSEGEPRMIVQTIRLVLESHCRHVCYLLFEESDTLGTIVDKIRKAGSEHPLFRIQEPLEELNTYSRRYHHGENPKARMEPIDESELAGYVSKTLRIVGGSLY